MGAADHEAAGWEIPDLSVRLVGRSQRLPQMRCRWRIALSIRVIPPRASASLLQFYAAAGFRSNFFIGRCSLLRATRDELFLRNGLTSKDVSEKTEQRHDEGRNDSCQE